MFNFLKSLFCRNHDYVITHIKAEGLRKGTIIVDLVCKKCGSAMQTFHDLTETEDIRFRHPQVEDLLFKQGYLEKKNGKLLLRCD
jgi:hypothetical protein